VQEAAEQLIGHVEISNDDYHAGPGISKSHLDVIAEKSPLHYWFKYLNPDREIEEPTDAMELGTAIHAAILEPDLFTSNFVVSPAFNMRTKDGKQMFADFRNENPGKQILTPDDFKVCLAIRDRVHTNPVAAGLLTGGKSEQSFFAKDPETGELIKCRFDYLQDGAGMALDVKSTRDASKRAFAKDAANLRYDIAVAWYFDVMKALYGEAPRHWVWLAVEKTPPYAVGIYFAKPDDIERARDEARRNFMTIVNCRQANYWPDYAESVEPLDMPGWLKR
jgi:PDDEXK-like domain of unknown function (DUF3799)